MSTKVGADATRWPQSVIARFVARRSISSATFAALAFGTFTASKTIGYADIYPSAHDRLVAGALMMNNLGFTALFGTPHQVDTAAGYAAWYGVTMGVFIGGIWSYLLATKVFRGEEAVGRWELLLAGQTTARRAATNALCGIAISLGLFYAIAAGALIWVGANHNVGFGVGPALYFALAVVSAAVMFAAIGGFTSQLMATRARAAGAATAVFGVAFLIRAAGDITSAHWLLNLSPLGWIEQLQPLTNPQPFWLIPITIFTAGFVAATIYLAGRRDLGASFIRDRDTSQPHNRFLGGPLGLTFRFTRANASFWLLALSLYLAFFGALANTAAKVLSTGSAAQYISRLAKASAESGARAFLGIAFFLLMALIMAYAANAVGLLRSDEAQGYLDHLLVRPVSRQRWLWIRIGLIALALGISAPLLAGVTWLSMTANHNGISFHDLLIASINTLPPACLTLGIGIFTFGLRPRLTTVVAYGVIAWSFIIELLSSGANLSHWLLDTSVFHHVAYAPAADPKWGNGVMMVVIGLTLMLIGALAFNRRDLASE